MARRLDRRSSTRLIAATAIGLACAIVFPACGGSAQGVESLEQWLLEHLQTARSRRGLGRLDSHDALSRVARERASQLAGRTELGSTAAEVTALERRLWRLGYSPHYWGQAIVAGHLDSSTIKQTRLEPALLRSELEHVAISCHRWEHAPEHTSSGLKSDPGDQAVCLIMVGEQQLRYQQRVAEPLRDIDAVRRAVLAEVNRIRGSRGLEPLRGNEQANLAAQRHARDMLKRDFYAHRSPDGKGLRQRATEAGLNARGLAENIAKVVTTPEDAVARWMSSSGHRRNILLKRAREHGLGVAVGVQDGEVVALWCQVIATQ